MHRISCSHKLILGSSGGIAPQVVQGTYREKLSFLASKRGLEGEPPLSSCWALLPCSRLADSIFPVFSLSLHSQIWIYIILRNSTFSTLMTPCNSTPLNSPTARGSLHIMQLALAHTVVFLKNSQRSPGPRQVAADWPQCSLCLLLSFLRLSTSATSESSFTW